MTMIRRTYPAAMSELGPRQVRVRASTGNLGRDGLIVHPAGIDLAHYRQNPVMLWAHDPQAPIARATVIGMEGDDLVADVEFAPAGVSATADEICGLVKAGIINAVSIGFDPLETEPLDARKPRAGRRVLRSELMEISFVSVPADREAIVLQRKMEILAGLTTPEEWHLAEERPADRAARKPRTRGMYAVGELAWLMECLSGIKHSTEIESALEGDASAVPAMLATAVQNVGAALIAMTAEEVAELIGDTEVDPVGEMGDLDEPDVVLIMAAPTPAIRQFRIGFARAKAVSAARAGKALSAETMRALGEAMGEHDEGALAMSTNLSDRAAALRLLSVSASPG